ncbi:M48 family metallopeptidase [Teredinibacter haidensis]|uniref:M48 family metallopeptidase n=1 Tax=Teredinibacter haidensis TaxID=2731755 RepID=UPI000948FB18|nr:M48 family metallopeptidase [Teredinibacter haidensis]
MNFFQHQDVARKKTTLLVVLLLMAVLSLSAITVFALGIFFYVIQTNSNSISAVNAQSKTFPEHLWIFTQSDAALWITLSVIAVVGMATLYKYIQLGAGGKKVAEALGGNLLVYDGASNNEKRLLNVVEEMAIASGNPVPPVYVLEEKGINAFAAGLHSRDAVVGITRGCLDLLNREELQGVIAHEFSHIHNGDMRLNMRLVAILHGILIIGLIGYFIMHGSGGYRGRHHGYRSSTRSRSKNQGAQMGLGLALVAIGYGGTFFGNIIKAAVSRQREFLADASAVQYTRSSNGIGNALKKIGGYSGGSTLSNGAASQFSHMYFGQGIKTSFAALMATHPPLHERIKRVLPRWNGGYLHPEESAPQHQQQADLNGEIPNHNFVSSNLSAEQFQQMAVASIGEPQAQHLKHAQTLIGGLPQNLRDAAHQAFSARALIYCLLLDANRDIRQQQIAQLKDAAHPATFNIMQSLYRFVYQLPREQHLALIEMSIPALKLLSAPQYDVFKRNLIALVHADKHVSLFEWCLYRILTNAIEPRRDESSFQLRDLAKEISLVFSLVVHAGKSQSPGGAFQKGIESLGLNKIKFTLDSGSLSFQQVDAAIEKLACLKVLQKPRFLKALADIIAADGKVRAVEKELFRAIAHSLDCPVPPLLGNDQ